MKTQECNSVPRKGSVLHTYPISFGIPAGICAVGCGSLLLPGVSPLTMCAGWLIAYLAAAVPYSRKTWSSLAGAWTLFGASLVLAFGIILNCHYYICVWGHGDVSQPVLMNTDAWSAWNNALVDNGRADAYPCPWPAVGYGHFVGLIVAAFGADICIPLLFNALCALATIALTGCIAQMCAQGNETERRHMATCAMVISAFMCYFMASGTVLIKDTPLAAAVALTAWAALRMRTGRTPWAVAAIAAAAVVVTYARPNYLLVLIAVIAVACRPRRREAIMPACLCAVLAAVWLLSQGWETSSPIGNYIDMSTRNMASADGDVSSHSAYYGILGDYYSLPSWQRILLLPVTVAIQFLIPFPWTCGKYLVFGPFMAVAHFSFFRYAAGALVMYFIGRQIPRAGRAPVLLLRMVAIGLLFYCASAFQFAGSISRYGIPLIALIVPAAAYAWVSYRRERAFRLWCAVFAAGMTAVLFICHHISQ